MIERDPKTGFPIFRPDGAVLRAFMRDRTSRVKIIQGPQGSGTSSACCMHIFQQSLEQPKQADGRQRFRAHVFRECYDDQTEILTERRGWQLFRNLLATDKVAQLNGDELEFVAPLDFIAKSYVGEMIGFESEGADFKVTPHHRLWVSTIYGRDREWLPFKFECAEDAFGKDVRVRRDAKWSNGQTPHSEALFEWLGLWFAEGYGNSYPQSDGYTRRKLGLTQCKPAGIEYARGLFKRANLLVGEAKRADGGINFHVLVRPETKWLFDELCMLGGARQKAIPYWIKSARRAHLDAFLRGFIFGDGWTSNGTTKARTSSFALANDLQEIAVRAGKVVNVSAAKAFNSIAANAIGIAANGPGYDVTFVTESKYRPRLNETYKSKSQYRRWYRERYAGMIYCVEVPTHIIYVRRKGKAMWCGQTYSKLEETAIKTWKDWFPPGTGAGQFGRFFETRPYLHEVRVGPLELDVTFMAMEDIADAKSYFMSLETSLIWFNEGQFAQYDVIREAVGRVSPPRYPAVKDGGCAWGGLILDSNAPPADHWIPIMRGDMAAPDWMSSDQRRALIKPASWSFYVQPPGLLEDIDDKGRILGYRQNPVAENLKYLPAGFYLEKTAGQTKAWIDANIMNRSALDMDGRPVYPQFRKDVHVSDRPLSPIDHTPVVVGLDFGRQPAALIGQALRGDWFIQREFIGRDVSAVEFAPALKSFLASYYPGYSFNFWGDPAGQQKGQATDKTPFEVFREHGMWVRPAPNPQNQFSVRHEAVNAVMMRRSLTGRPSSLLVDPRCVTYITGMTGGYYMRRIRVSGERHADVPEKNQYSHICEAGENLFLGGGEGKAVTMGTVSQMPVRVWKGKPGVGRRIAG